MNNVDTVLLTFDMAEGRAAFSVLVDGTYAISIGDQWTEKLHWKNQSLQEGIDAVVSMLGGECSGQDCIQ